MTWSVGELRDAPLDRLLDRANQPVPTLLRMHAIKELAVRAVRQTAPVSHALSSIAMGLDHASRVGGLPVGYLGAKVLYDETKTRHSLLTALAAVPPVERDDLLHWLDPEPTAARRHAPAIVERELIVERNVEGVYLEQAIRDVLRVPVSPLKVDMLHLSGPPHSVAMVSLSNHHWIEMERRAAQLSEALQTTTYWPPPDELGALGPDLRIAVRSDGRRELVVARYTVEGFDVVRYPEPEASEKGSSRST